MELNKEWLEKAKKEAVLAKWLKPSDYVRRLDEKAKQIIEKNKKILRTPYEQTYFFGDANADGLQFPEYYHGGMIKKTGKILIHKGEMIIPKKNVAKVKSTLKKAGVKPY